MVKHVGYNYANTYLAKLIKAMLKSNLALAKTIKATLKC